MVNNNSLPSPMPVRMINFIKYKYPQLSDLLLSTIENTVIKSENHYPDLLSSLEPILGSHTTLFINTLFMYNKKECKSGIQCSNEHCLFLHLSEKGEAVEERDFSAINFDSQDVILNKVIPDNEATLELLKSYAEQFGEVFAIRRLNYGKYVIVFRKAEDAKLFVSSPEYVINNQNIKKYFSNCTPPRNPTSTNMSAILDPLNTKRKKPFNPLDLCIEMDKHIKEIENTGKTNIPALKIIALRIKNFIKSKENKYGLSSNRNNNNFPIKLQNKKSTTILSSEENKKEQTEDEKSNLSVYHDLFK